MTAVSPDTTRPADESETANDTSLAAAIETDRDRDTRQCRDDDCHGQLEVTEDDHVRCTLCYCRPDGVFAPPPDESDTGERQTPFCSQTNFLRPYWIGSNRENPHPSRGETDRPRYHHSGNVRLVGGVEEVYNEDPAIRPTGVDGEYTFDLSTL